MVKQKDLWKNMHQMKAIEKELLSYVHEYFTKFRKPISMKIVSSRFARGIVHWSKGNETIKTKLAELAKEGKIVVTLCETGSYVISPGLTKWEPKL